MKKHIYLFALLLFAALRLDASHIVGAQLYYDCLGNNTYRITLVEYRNCSASCAQCANYGDPEYIQVFDTAGNYIDSFQAPYQGADTLISLASGRCSTPFEYCVEKATFQVTATLPPIPGGYIVVFQRCCRNTAIMNITQGSGATYFTAIADSNAIQGCDNKPRFRQMVSGIIPIDTLFTFDMSATDPDGDSLVYRLTNSYDGANGMCPNPSPAGGGIGGCPGAASPPPYTSVPYLSPYSPFNPTNDPFDSGYVRIDSNTGLLSGRVNQTGIFLIAVAADEYRNGVLIGSTLLDFQFLFGGCGTTVNSTANISDKTQVKIFSRGNEAVIEMPDQNNGHAKIIFYDLLGQQISSEKTFSGNVYTRHFENIPSQYLIAKVELSDGEIKYQKLFIENSR
jgi:hypothetical protein